MPPPFKPNVELDPNVLYRDSSGASPSNTQEEDRQQASNKMRLAQLVAAGPTFGISLLAPAVKRGIEAMTEGGKFRGVRAGLSGVGRYARDVGQGVPYLWSGEEEEPRQSPTNLVIDQLEPPYTSEEASSVNAYRNQLARLARGGFAGVEPRAPSPAAASPSTPPPPPPPPQEMTLYPQGIRFQPASRGASLADSASRIVSSGVGTSQVGGRSIMGDYVDTVRSGLLAQEATAKAQQLGNTPEGRAYAEIARANDEAYQSAKQAFASKYGPNASNIFQQASQQLSSRGITPEQLMSGAADRMTENVVFPQYGEVLPGMGVATDAQGRIVRSVTGAPSGAPQTVYTPTAQGIQATSLAPSQTLMDPGLAAYLGASQITPEAARITVAGLPAMQSALTKRERAQLQQQQIARADLARAREAARSQYGLGGFAPPELEKSGFTKEALTKGSALIGENATLQKLRADTEDPQLRRQYEEQMKVNNALLSKYGYQLDPTTGIWGLPSAGGTPKGLGASTEQLKPGAVGSKGFVNMGKERREFLSKYAAAMQKAPEVAPEQGSEADVGRKVEMDTLRKEGARLGILFDDKGAAREMTAAELPKAATRGQKADEATQDAYLRFYGTSAAASKALKAAGYSDEA